MNYEWTEERKRYAAARGMVVLSACPGSGKTTSIAYKLTTLIEEWEKLFGRYQGIVCLSFTNVAKDEIEEKYSHFCNKEIGFPHLVSTIDSFINQYITLPFFHLIEPDINNRPRIIDNLSFIDDWEFKYYFQVQGKEGKSTIRPVKYQYPPSSIDIDLNGEYLSKLRRPSLEEKELGIFNKYCKQVKKVQFSNGLLKNSDSTYVALTILRTFPEVARTLATRFPYIIVDEAQDTSEIQYAIFEELMRNGLKNIELIGDPYQSLYQWRNARHDLFIQRFQSEQWSKLTFTECRRSTQAIVDCYSKLRSAGDPKLKSVAVGIKEEPIHVIMFDDDDLLLKKYEELAEPYSNRKIVVRGETHLKRLAAFNEAISLWKIDPCVPNELVFAKHEMIRGDVKGAVNRIRKCLPVLIDPEVLGDYKRQRDLLDGICDEYSWNARIIEMLSNLPSLDFSLRDWTTLTQKLLKEVFELKCEHDFQLKAGKYNQYHKKPMSELFGSAVNSEKVTTVHQVKGKTFDSLMLVLSENSAGASISLKDLVHLTSIDNEKTRIIYVGMSRPRIQLVLAVPKGEVEEKHIKETLGENTRIHIV